MYVCIHILCVIVFICKSVYMRYEVDWFDLFRIRMHASLYTHTHVHSRTCLGINSKTAFAQMATMVGSRTSTLQRQYTRNFAHMQQASKAIHSLFCYEPMDTCPLDRQTKYLAQITTLATSHICTRSARPCSFATLKAKPSTISTNVLPLSSCMVLRISCSSTRICVCMHVYAYACAGP
jgi:hypothetical protein